MRALAATALVLFTIACGSKKDPPTSGSAEPSKGTAAEPPKGSAAEPPKGIAAEPPKGIADPGSAGSAGSAAAGSDAGSATAAGSGSGSGAGFNFDKLTRDQKMDFMKKQVVPKMKPIFQKFDPKEFANFGCKTCHGKEPQKTKFKMPSSDLPKLDFVALEAGKQKPEVAKFMGTVVKPQMAKLLKQPEFDPKNPKAGGFGCLECHEQKK